MSMPYTPFDNRTAITLNSPSHTRPETLCREAASPRGAAASKFYGQAGGSISTGKLNALPRLHTQPINVVVFHGPP
jgi:hypothetical protein